MRKSEWSDNQLEEWIKQLPKVKDPRDPRDIYQNISIQINKSRRVNWIIPSFATAAALLVFFLLVPTFLNDSSNEDKSSVGESTASMDKTMKNSLDKSDMRKAESINFDSTQKDSLNTADTVNEGTTVNEEDLKNKELLIYAIPSQDAQVVVPISILVEKNSAKTKFDQFKDNMPKLTEEEWGLSDYYPLNAKLEYKPEHKKLIVDVPNNHQYGTGSGSEIMFQKILSSELLLMNIEKVSLMTDGQQGIEFGNKGKLYELSVTDSGKHGYFFYYPNKMTDKPYLVPSDEQYQTIQDALSAMSLSKEDHDLKASIPKELNIEKIKESDKILTIYLSNNTIIPEGSKALHMIEAILLTAKEFKYKAVKIENAKVSHVGKFNLANEMQVPIAPNKKEISE